ncbi:MAG: hypothetical protein AB4042_03995 [Leptolyngbyaceae cyanobacterium]
MVQLIYLVILVTLVTLVTLVIQLTRINWFVDRLVRVIIIDRLGHAIAPSPASSTISGVDYGMEW